MLKVLSPVLAMALAHPALAASATVQLLSGWREEGVHVAALKFELPEGWHTYWRVPGAAGVPLRIDWQASSNIDRVEVVWPHPEIFESSGLTTIGYRDSIVLPIMVHPVDDDKPVRIDAQLEYGLCRDVCILSEAALRTTLHAAAGGSAGDVVQIEAAMARAPVSASEAGVASSRCSERHSGETSMAEATVRWPDMPSTDFVAVIEADPAANLWFGEAQARAAGGSLVVAAPVEGLDHASDPTRDPALRLTLLNDTSYIEISDCPLTPPSGPAAD